MLGRARARAKAFGLPFDLELSDIRIPTHCPALGLELTHRNGRGAHPLPSSASLDRIVPERGYVKGNVVVVSYLANTIKNQASLAQLEAVTAFYRKVFAGLSVQPDVER